MSDTNTPVEKVPDLSFANEGTFLKAPRESPDELSPDTDVVVFGAPFDGAVSRRPGTRYGPRALRAASGWYDHLGGAPDGAYNADTDRSVAHDEMVIRDCGDVSTVPNDVERTRQQVERFVTLVAETGFPVMLGGDHYLTYPAFCGFAERIDGDVGLIHLDAHSDTVSSSALYGDHWHGSPMARINESTYGSYERHAMIGIRGYEHAGFDELVANNGIMVKYARDVRNEGIESCVRAAIDHATTGVDAVYLTVDIDAVDPAYAPGTGTPEPAGLTSSQLLTAMDQLGTCPEIGALDLMEVAPNLDDNSETTAMLGANAVVRFLERRFC